MIRLQPITHSLWKWDECVCLYVRIIRAYMYEIYSLDATVFSNW